jgi:hypothetical protein
VKLHLIHWKPEEAATRIGELAAAGHETTYAKPDNSGTMKHIHASAPQAIVIDLSRTPSHGKAVATEIRRSPKLRATPIVFAAGDPAKIATVQQLFPDAIYSSWEQIASALRKARPLISPVVPAEASSFAQYANRPLAQKLGIKSAMSVALIHAPLDFDRTAADFPPDIEWQPRANRSTELILLFAESQAQLEAGFARVARTGLPIWVFWPKQASGRPTDLTQHIARTFGQALGYTDCKVCSFDSTWSGFLFRLKKRAAGK